MNSTKTEDLAKLILRLVVGGMMLFHGISKIQNGIGGIEAMLAAKSLPAFLAYGVYVGEIVAPLLLLIGLFTRLSALIFAFNMAIAVVLAHSGDFLKLTEYGGWMLELHALYFFGAIAIFLLGPGQFSFDATRANRKAIEQDPSS